MSNEVYKYYSKSNWTYSLCILVLVQSNPYFFREITENLHIHETNMSNNYQFIRLTGIQLIN